MPMRRTSPGCEKWQVRRMRPADGDSAEQIRLSSVGAELARASVALAVAEFPGWIRDRISIGCADFVCCVHECVAGSGTP